jgi:arylsulfatase A-like enzyme
VLGKVREVGIEEDTLLIFVNDNGGPTGANGSDNGPLRGTKGTMYEGGIRVPFIVQWPRRLKRGLTYDHPVISLDILPTAAAVAKLPRDHKMDGVNLIPYLTGKKKTAPHDTLFWRTGQNHAVRKGNWKLVKMGGKTALFDLTSDIGETRDLTAERPDVTKEIEKAYEQWNSQMVAPLWKLRRRKKKPRKKTKKKKNK